MSESFIPVTRFVQNAFAAKREKERTARYGQAVLPHVLVSPAPVASWEPGKLMAIMLIYRTQAAKDCIAHWQEQGIKASQRDFLVLRNSGLAFRRETGALHELTATGKRYAADATNLVAKRLGLHHIEYHGSTRYSGASCTCGWRCSYDERFGLTRPKVERAISAHLRNLAMGTNG